MPDEQGTEVQRFGRALACAATLLLTGCVTPPQAQSRAMANFESPSLQRAVKTAMTAALDGGFTIRSSDPESGLIVVTRAGNPLLTGYSSPTMNIVVQHDEGRATLSISSILSGQVFDYGTSARTVADYCRALSVRVPEANCSPQR